MSKYFVMKIMKCQKNAIIFKYLVKILDLYDYSIFNYYRIESRRHLDPEAARSSSVTRSVSTSTSCALVVLAPKAHLTTLTVDPIKLNQSTSNKHQYLTD